MTDVDIKIENIVASASIGKDIVLTEVSQALEGVNFNREQFPGLVFKLKDPKTAALIFSSGKLVCTGAKSIDDSKLAIKKTVDLMREVDTEIPHEFEIKIQNIDDIYTFGEWIYKDATIYLTRKKDIYEQFKTHYNLK